MVRIEPFNGGSGSSGNGSPPPVSPSSCSSWPPPLPNTFPYPPQEAAFGFSGPHVSWPVSYYPPNPYPYGPYGFEGYGYGYRYGYAPYVECVPYNVNYQPQTWFQPPMQTGSGHGVNPVRASGLRRGGGEGVLQKGTTTLMIRNIPTRLRRDELMNLLDEHCKEQNKGTPRLSPNHKAAYDFLYLPFDFIKRGNLGYAFVNFTTARAAFKFFKCWSGRGWMDFYRCTKICAITRAVIQGKEPSKRHLERCTFFCDTEEYLPVEFSPPRDGNNAAATKMTTFGNQVRRSEKMAAVWRKKRV